VASEQVLGGKYTITRDVVRRDRSSDLPSLYEVTDAGSFLFARTWTRIRESVELKALWNHEVRTLLRLAGYPRSNEYFVSLRDLGFDEKRFFVVIDAGEREPLSSILLERGRHAWLRDSPTPARRRRIWQGLRRVATAIGILHEEGTVHRAIAPQSIFTDVGGECDFRLDGFEWSLRIGTPTQVAQTNSANDVLSRLRAPELDGSDTRYSFATDWFDFGVLCTELFGFAPTGQGRRTVEQLREVVLNLGYLSPPEKATILGLLEIDPDQRFAQTATVLQSLSEAQASAYSRTVVIGRPLYVGFLLGLNSRLSESIADLTKGGNGDIRRDDAPAQLAFIERDLNDDPQILVRQHSVRHYVVNGRLLQYRIQQWGRTAPKTWDVGFCMSAEPPLFDPTERTAMLDGRKIEVRTAPRLLRDIKRARELAAPWDVIFPHLNEISPLDDDQKTVLEFFRITNQLDALLAAAQIWPVRVINAVERYEQTYVELAPDPSGERNDLAQNLKLPPSDEQMREFLNRDSVVSPLAEEVGFTLAYGGVLGRGDEEAYIHWRYDRQIRHPAGMRYRFVRDAGLPPPMQGTKMYLMPAGLAGTVEQLKRRRDAIERMSSHGQLLSAIADPDGQRRDTLESPGTNNAIEMLDDSKRAALKAIWQTQPLYTLQGPPGTGKTRLLETMAARLLEEDASVQLLVTAHSHEAVRHVRSKLSERISEQSAHKRPIIVRLDDDEDADHVRRATGRIAKAVAESTLARQSPGHILQRARETAADLANATPATRDIRSLEALVRQSANVVFATSNSGELARMLEDNRRFDWSIIEEAGKAHGFDLAMALQASSRVLMIGDQQQLPPFNYSAFEDLFREPPRILNAMSNGVRFAPALVGRDYLGLDEDDQQRFVTNCSNWLTMVQFFKEMFNRCERSIVGDTSIAMQLELQHRMHPDIAELISHCFYKGKLKTHDDATKRFNSTPAPFVTVPGGWLPDQRIVFVDLPWLQEKKGATGEEGGEADGKRRYSNPAEIDAAVKVLSQFAPVAGVECHIQMLSPYRAQIRKLSDAISEHMDSDQLCNLSASEFNMGKAKRLGATVDEFQGSEADIVVASLVRNNDEKIGKGLGFLADDRRVNVLLSRARHKLVLVGSWSFLASRIDCSVEPHAEEELAHIARLMRWLDKEKTAGRVARVPVETIFWGGKK
jgi:serine/threonine protein kinase